MLKDFKFSDGSIVLVDNVICAPQQAIMWDSKYYDRLNEFLPFRFVSEHTNSHNDDAIQKVMDLKTYFYLWGAGAKPW